ncbi:hypothetical protein DFH07DRAFT_784785 [Mycena maculata]|uniref:Uncharacterized protein n=1 Tax=Mycena maculata TaxID=230809 RepID=A0AAD7HEU1_9AGAR|nr:hypothetical protein DFH07DRAFT_784785 [Mycena maculata]
MILSILLNFLKAVKKIRSDRTDRNIQCSPTSQAIALEILGCHPSIIGSNFDQQYLEIQKYLKHSQMGSDRPGDFYANIQYSSGWEAITLEWQLQYLWVPSKLGGDHHGDLRCHLMIVLKNVLRGAACPPPASTGNKPPPPAEATECGNLKFVPRAFQYEGGIPLIHRGHQYLLSVERRPYPNCLGLSGLELIWQAWEQTFPGIAA